MSDLNTEYEKAPQKLGKVAKYVILGFVCVLFIGFIATQMFSGSESVGDKTDRKSAMYGGIKELNNDNMSSYSMGTNEELENLKLSVDNMPDDIKGELREEFDAKLKAAISKSGRRASGVEYSYKPNYEMRKRMSEPYSKMVAMLGNPWKDLWEMDNGKYQKHQNVAGIETVYPENRDLYEGVNKYASGMTTLLPSGTRIIARTEMKVSSDHPGYFTSKILRPFALKGYKLLCESGANLNDRIPINPVKIVSSEGREYALAGQVQMEYPGMKGKVKSHWFKRMGPAIANATIGGSFVYWANQDQGNGRISTRDALVAPIVESSVTGLQNEISLLGGNHPNTVTVSQGTQFMILLTEQLKVQ